MAPLLHELDAILADKAHPVTARWLCYQHGVGVSEAQDALDKCAANAASKVAVTYLLTGALRRQFAHVDVPDQVTRHHSTHLRLTSCGWVLRCMMSMPFGKQRGAAMPHA